MLDNIAAPESDNRRAAGHSFNSDDSEVLFLRENEGLGTGVNSGQILVAYPAHEFNVGLCQILESLLIRAAADNFQFPAQPVESLNHNVKALVGHQPANHQKIILFFLVDKEFIYVNWRVYDSGLFFVVFFYPSGDELRVGDIFIGPVGAHPIPDADIIHEKGNEFFDDPRKSEFLDIFLAIVPSVSHWRVAIADVKRAGRSNRAFGVA